MSESEQRARRVKDLEKQVRATIEAARVLRTWARIVEEESGRLLKSLERARWDT